MPRADIQAFRLLITAGPTHEPIDAVRYVGNRSSGRMGVALAEAAVANGLPTTLLLGPCPKAPEVDTPLAIHRFRTTSDLQDRLRELWPVHDVLIMAAAVADFRPTASHPADKTPRDIGPLHLELEPTPDLLVEVASLSRPDQTVIGFALEPPDRLVESARQKLRRKNLDAIVANPLETMDSEVIEARVFLRSGRELTPPKMAKIDFARWLIEEIPSIRSEQSGTAQS